jgi:hypothetical protein
MGHGIDDFFPFIIIPHSHVAQPVALTHLPALHSWQAPPFAWIAPLE